MRKRILGWTAALWLGWVLVPQWGAGQGATQALRGCVQDGTGAALPGAAVLLCELGIGTLTDSLGCFSFTGLRAGEYHLHIRVVGYTLTTAHCTLPQTEPLLVLMQEPSTELETVLIEETRQHQEQRQSQTAQRLNLATLREHTAHSLAEVMARLPGVTFANLGVGQTKPVVRGLWGNRVAVIENGIRQEGQQWGADHGLEIDAFMPGEVTVEMGPRSLAFGPEAIAGVVVIRPPAWLPDSAVEVGGLFIYRSVNNNYSTSTSAALRRGPWVTRMRVSTQDYADYRVPADSFTYNRYRLPLTGNALKNTAGQERNASAALGFIGDKATHTLTVSYFGQESGLFAGAVGTPRAYQLVPDGNPRNRELPRTRTQHIKGVLNSTLQLSHTVSLAADVGFQDNLRTESSQPDAHGYPQGAQLGTTGHKLHLRTGTANARLRWLPFSQLVLESGITAEVQEHRFEGYEFILPRFQREGMGAYGWAQWHIAPKWHLTGGLRWDVGRVRIAAHSQALYGADGTYRGEYERNPDLQRAFQAPSVAAGASWLAGKGWVVKLNGASAFRFPQPYELAANGVHHGAFRHEQGNPTLMPERGYTLDAAIEYGRGGWFAGVTPFATFFDRFVFLEPAPRFSILPEGGQLYAYTQAQAQLVGGEVRLAWQSAQWQQNGLRVGIAADIVRGQNLTSQLPLPFMPPPSILFELTYRKARLGPLRQLRLHSEAQAFAAQNRVARNEAPTPAYTLVNAAIGFCAPWPNLPIRLEVQVQNLLNARYMRHLSRYRILNLPEPGRNVVVALSIPLSYRKGQKPNGAATTAQ